MNLNKFDYRMMEMAREEANKSDFKVKVGCVITVNHTIISKSHNSSKTHPLQNKYNILRPMINIQNPDKVVDKVHAEIAALSKIKYLDVDWSRVNVYVYRKMGLGFGNSRPCAACMGFIRSLGIKNIYYTTNDGYAYERIIY